MDLAVEAGLVESVLLLENEPTDISTICRITKLAKEVVEKSLEILKQEYEHENHGIEIIEIGDGYSFSPKLKYWNSLKDRYGKRNDKRLSKAALETLSIIAYSQPITRAEIENIRGVSADSMIKFLQSQELIKEVGRKEAPGRPALYGTTKEFLKIFRLGSIADLPKLNEIDTEKFAET